MADAIKRIGKARSKVFQDQNEYYIRAKAKAVLALETPDTDDLKLAKAVYARTVKLEDVAMVCVDNSTIGAAIDVDDDPAESDIEYVWLSSSAFNDLATSMVSAGVIS